jgi:hypothetical protein
MCHIGQWIPAALPEWAPNTVRTGSGAPDAGRGVLDGFCRGSVYSRDGGRAITHKSYMGITLTGYRLQFAGLRLMANRSRPGGVAGGCYDAVGSGDTPGERRPEG